MSAVRGGAPRAVERGCEFVRVTNVSSRTAPSPEDEPCAGSRRRSAEARARDADALFRHRINALRRSDAAGQLAGTNA
ncbi:hypothetical protein DR62_07460 [Burkholderia thailandensis]|nr:hypothetical protein DR62_07460 [Burkholderia thailandensis]AOI54980.1 hypothetical protein WI24_24605 [Burkholderia thailandensis]AOJ53592.1 hypothetical protein AQ475_22445 [Burkholderia thailandensis]AVR28274.1 hypothetical protein A8H32_25490 [Burkholderia thailandensis]MDW9234897.1 hypothetical protein [Burkholderia thailandensis]